MRHLVTIAAAVAAVGIGTGAALALTSAAPPADGHVPVSVTNTSCGTHDGWHLEAGQTTFELTSHAAGFSAVYLESASRDVVAEDLSLPHGSTHALATTLDGGTYRLRCVLTNASVRQSGPVRVHGHVTEAAHGYRPMRSSEMVAPVQAYSRWVGAQLPGLVSACRTLDADVARGDLAHARTDWLTAHLAYERLGAAYGAFGDIDGRLNGMSAGLPQGTATPDWTGFFAIEHALWGGRSAAQVRPLTRALVTDAETMQKEWPSDEVDPGDLPLRTHEILENALQFQLTGAADEGSGTTLATTYANTQGTAELLGTLTPKLREASPGLLAHARTQLAAVQADLLAQRSPAGAWTPVEDLTDAARAGLDADMGTLLETLAQVPATVDPRNGA